MIASHQNELAPNAVSKRPDDAMKSVGKTRPARHTTRQSAVANKKDPDLPLTPRQIRLVRESFRRVQSQSAIAGLIFYRNLFATAPALRSMFQSSIELQGRKLMEALDYTVATIDNPKVLAPVLEALGRRHVSYGTQDEHYPVIANVLMQTLKETLGRDFSKETQDAWQAALEFVAGIMKRGAAPVHDLKSVPAGNKI